MWILLQIYGWLDGWRKGKPVPRLENHGPRTSRKPRLENDIIEMESLAGLEIARRIFG